MYMYVCFIYSFHWIVMNHLRFSHVFQIYPPTSTTAQGWTRGPMAHAWKATASTRVEPNTASAWSSDAANVKMSNPFRKNGWYKSLVGIWLVCVILMKARSIYGWYMVDVWLMYGWYMLDICLNIWEYIRNMYIYIYIGKTSKWSRNSTNHQLIPSGVIKHGWQWKMNHRNHWFS